MTSRLAVINPHEVISKTTISMISNMLGAETTVDGRADRIVKQLERAISVGLLSHGDKLPAEPELAEQLGVSPLTLRQSLADLRAKGLLATKRGRGGGSVVNVEPQRRSRLIEDLLTWDLVELRELGDFAGSVAQGVAQLAAVRADSDDIRQVKAAAQQFADASNPQDLRRTDSRFHISVSVASHSRRLSNTTMQIYGELAPLTWLDETWAEHAVQAQKEHEAIIEAISNRDAGLAGELYQAHFDHELSVIMEVLLKSIEVAKAEDE